MPETPKPRPPAAKDDAGTAEVQAKMDEEQEKGYYGAVTDPTPNANYTVQTPDDAPTPETDEDLRNEAREARGQR